VIKKFLAYSLYWSGLAWLKLVAIRIFGTTKLRILCYHRVCYRDESHVFDQGVVTATVLEFRKQIDFLRRYFHFTTFAEISQNAAIGSMPQRPLILTFDDGYIDNYSHVFPILKTLGIPATIFLATGFINTQKLFWWDQIWYFVKLSDEQNLYLTWGDIRLEYEISSPHLKRFAAKELITFAKRFSHETRQCLIDYIREQLKIPSSFISPARALLTWDEINEMRQNNIEFGGHTRNHSILLNMSMDKAEQEISSSMIDIRKHTGEYPLAFAYPNGDHDDTSVRAVDKSGFKYACTLNKGVNDSRSNPFTLKRIPADMTGIVFKVTLAFPQLMSLTTARLLFLKTTKNISPTSC
jgi:peptidoglycan/xylan/chitin deacetylase (PgdA/CDA1 family)